MTLHVCVLLSPSFILFLFFWLMCSQVNEHRSANVLLVGQVYIDTILHVTEYPEEDTKTRAVDAEQRIGGNTYNTAQVLAQFHHLNVCYMSAAGSRETSR